MPDSQKIPFASSMQRFVKNSINDSSQGIGLALPCSIVSVNGAIVTVNFDIDNKQFTPPPVTCATIGSKYIRVPLRKGDTGICVAANARLGGINGLGSGIAPLINPSNLGGLVFIPIGNKNWDVVDSDAVVTNTPNGASFSTYDGSMNVVLSKSLISLDYNGNSVVINSAGVSIIGALTINGVPYLDHEHSGVQTGGSNTGGVV